VVFGLFLLKGLSVCAPTLDGNWSIFSSILLICSKVGLSNFVDLSVFVRGGFFLELYFFGVSMVPRVVECFGVSEISRVTEFFG